MHARDSFSHSSRLLEGREFVEGHVLEFALLDGIQENFQFGDHSRLYPDPLFVKVNPCQSPFSRLVRAWLIVQQRHLHWETQIYVNCKISMKQNMW